MFKNLRDYLWVVQVFLRGKVLRQKAYMPQGNCFRLPVPMTTYRILMLMKWWGLRPLTQAEGEALMKQQRFPSRVPGFSWDGERWNTTTDPSDWDNGHRFIRTR